MLDAKVMLSGYVMFKKNRQERRGDGVIVYIRDSIQAYDIQMEKEAECEEACAAQFYEGELLPWSIKNCSI